MNENYCSEILDKALSERHIEEAADAEAFFKARKIAVFKRNRILKSVSAFVACITLVLSLTVAAMFINSDEKSDRFEENESDYNDSYDSDYPTDDEMKDEDASDGIYGDEGDSDGESEDIAVLTGVYAINIGAFKDDTDTAVLSELLSTERVGDSVTLTSKQKETLEKQLKVYLKGFCAANSLGEEYSFEISSIGKEFSAHIFVRAFVTLGSGQTIELLIVTAK